MADPIVRGHSITLTVRTRDNSGDLADPTESLTVSILDANGVTVVNLDAPTTHVSTGTYQYVYAVPIDAVLGAWAAVWTAIWTGRDPVVDEDGFTVLREVASVPNLAGATTCSPWATSEDAPATITELDGVDLDDVDRAYQIATDILYELSSRRYPGICSDTIRPNAQFSKLEIGRWLPTLPAAFSLWGWCGCHRGRETGCGSVPEIKLPGHPVQRASIVVKIDGEVFNGWELHDGRFLVRTDGNGWPCCQNMLAGDDAEDTFSIAYTFGVMPDLGGTQSAVMLGSSLFVQFHPEFRDKCAVPKRATSVTRQGVTFQLKTASDMKTAGMTGIDFVDLWLNSKLYGRTNRPSAVMRPAQGKGRSARRIGR